MEFTSEPLLFKHVVRGVDGVCHLGVDEVTEGGWQGSLIGIHLDTVSRLVDGSCNYITINMSYVWNICRCTDRGNQVIWLKYAIMNDFCSV